MTENSSRHWWQVEVMKECGVREFPVQLEEKRKRILGSAVKFSICRASLSHFLNSEESIQPTALLSAPRPNRKPVQEQFQGSSLCSLLTSSQPYPKSLELFQLPSVNPHIKFFQDTRMSSFMTFSLSLALTRFLNYTKIHIKSTILTSFKYKVQQSG